MSDIIHLLPDSVANQIAAGEVIQRPASVIKELVENAVDAGATDIRIIIKDAGRTLIQVIDNGRGMSVTDARMAFERHATSKINKATDLFTLRTMGFRGEALPSICAISQVQVRTRTADDPIGTQLEIVASRVEKQEPAVCEKGTNIMVKNLFFNVPARRKFLKSDNVELANISREFERLALVNNNIRMSIDRGNGKPMDLRPGSFKQRIADLWKNNLNMQLIPVDVDTSLVKITGFVSRPENARRHNPLQYLIVNGRNMRHPYFQKAIANCFEKLIPSDAKPCYFIKFEVNPETIDVNIHPTKNEIKFENEQEIWKILTVAIKASLGKYAAVPSIDFNSEALPLQPLHDGETPSPPKIEVPEGYNPFERYFANPTTPISKSKSSSSVHRPTQQSTNWQSLYDSFMSEAEKHPEKIESTQLPIDEKEDVPGAVCMQLALKYILVPSREGLMVIDQHRAHVKILFERTIASGQNGELASQQSLFPESLILDETQAELLEEIAVPLHQLGFRLEEEDENQWKIVGVPADLKDFDAAQLIVRVIDSISDASIEYGKEDSPIKDMRQHITLLMARSAAIRKGRKLTGIEMEHIVSELFSLPSSALTPDGLPIYRIIAETEIEKLF